MAILRSFLFLSFLFSSGLYADGIRTIEEGPVHEAFATPVTEEYVSRAISHKPPQPIQENAPKQTDPEGVWVQGYWKWDKKWNDFLWVSGLWRNPPPDHEWIPGFWQEYPEGWVWVSGFWSDKSERDLTFLDIAPPDQIDEKVDYPPNQDYFWVPGHWSHSPDVNDFIWHPGRWEQLDPYWVLVPAHYVWRPEGFVFIPAYWDWPIDDRGPVYSCVYINPADRDHVVYEPYFVMEEIYVIRSLLLYYPDHQCFFHHHWHFHPGFWADLCCTPPWWGWDTWWCFTWHDNWALWWWYGHPGFPNPWWISFELSNQIPPPLPELLNWFKGILGPTIILKNGVISSGQLLGAIEKITDKDLPLLPSEPGLLGKIENAANPLPIDSRNILKPGGKRLPLDPRAVTPRVPKPQITPKVVPESSRPGVLPKKPVPQRPSRPPQAYPPSRQTPLPPPPPRYPPSVIDRKPPRPRPPEYRPESRPRPPQSKPPQRPGAPQYRPWPSPQPPQSQPRPRPKPPQSQPQPKPMPRPTPPQTVPPSSKYPPTEIQPQQETYPPQSNVPIRRSKFGKPLPRIRITPQTTPQGSPPKGEVEIDRGEGKLRIEFNRNQSNRIKRWERIKGTSSETQQQSDYQ